MAGDRVSMTPDQAKAVYAVLVETCGASSDDELGFSLHFTGSRPTNEWRFQGSLGFGGKFRYPKMTVDCYPEDQTPARTATIDRANTALASLRINAHA